MDKMREDFDKWYESIPSDEWNCLSLFDAWQASRAALVVQLPYESYGVTDAEIKQALGRAGIKWTE